jgi:DNA topoisomerase-1
MKLIIVESPTKSKSLSKFLDKEYKVLASFGHVRDLPENKFGVDIKNDFKPTYIILPKAKEKIKKIKEEVEKSEMVFLCTDPDREGESIAWHLVSLLKLNGKKPYFRAVFHEITEEAVKEALKNPRKIDMNLVEAQQTRRILDRIVGYKLSPFLWKKIARGLSAGRVQSVALRFIVEREREIQKFQPKEYWTIEVKLKIQKSKRKTQEFTAVLVKKDGKKLGQFAIKDEKEAKEIAEDLKGAEFKVLKIERKETKRNPPEPFTTSTMQQVAWQKFSWPAKKTMQIAQQLYEMGEITYHRTDSLNLSKFSLKMAENFILKNFGKNYHERRVYKTKSKVAQEAHEAIRPTNVERTPETLSGKLNPQQLKLYELIWRRFLASQMAKAIFDKTQVEISAKNYGFLAKGQVLKFDGFLKVYPIKFEEEILPELEVGEILEVMKILPLQHFTQPPQRYSEASLIKELEKHGIGRPSTYAPILATIQERNYVKKDEKKRFYPTTVGILVNDLLVKHFPEIVDVSFTAKMEEDLDKIANGEKHWVETLKEFYNPFKENLDKKYKEIEKAGILEKSEKTCPKCGGQLLVRVSKYGKFLACSNYPQCKYTFDLENSTQILCKKCNVGVIMKKKSKKGKIFWRCSNYPECDFVLWSEPTGENCPKCGFPLVKENKKIKCSNKECDFEKS